MRWQVSLALVTAVASGATGCGRFGFEARIDDAPDDTAMPMPDDALGAFGAPSMIPNISMPGADDQDAHLTPDLLELYFVSDRPGGQGLTDIWRATRTTTADPWGAPAAVVELSSTNGDSHPSLCCGGLVMYLASTRPPAQGTDLFRSTRTSLTAAWSPPALVAELSAPSYDVGGTATDDELELIIDTNRGSSVREIQRSTRASTADPWGTPQRIDELVPSMTLNEVEPTLANDTVLVFASAREGGGDFDLYVTSRASRGSMFGPVQYITEVNTTGEERDPWLSPDGRLIVFTRTVGSENDVYMATR